MLAALCLMAGEDPSVPADLQAALVSRVLRHDRQFSGEAQTTVKVLVVHSAAPSSVAFARQWTAALGEQPTFGGRAHDDALVTFESVEALSRRIALDEIRVVIFAPGTEGAAAALATALGERAVFTVSTTTRGVKEGLLLGFDLDVGKPQMHFNLAQARRQQVDLPAPVLKLMKVTP